MPGSRLAQWTKDGLRHQFNNCAIAVMLDWQLQ